MKAINRSLNHLNNLNKMARIIPVYKKSINNGLDVNRNETIVDKMSHKCESMTTERTNENLDQKVNQLINEKCQEINEKINSISLDQLNQEAIKEANNLLSQGKIIALPTDTIYGLACLVENDDSLNRLIEIKQRDQLTKRFAICVNNLKDIYKWSKVTVDKQILSELFPGPITVFFERSELLNKNLNPSVNLVGIRIPNDKFVHSLTCVNNPLVLTSANLSSEPSAGSIDEFKKLWPKLDAIFDAGQLNGSDPFRYGSTIVDLSVPNKFKIVRKGCALDQVLKILRDKYNFEEQF